jgi:hypothetical protein
VARARGSTTSKWAPHRQRQRAGMGARAAAAGLAQLGRGPRAEEGVLRLGQAGSRPQTGAG